MEATGICNLLNCIPTERTLVLYYNNITELPPTVQCRLNVNRGGRFILGSKPNIRESIRIGLWTQCEKNNIRRQIDEIVNTAYYPLGNRALIYGRGDLFRLDQKNEMEQFQSPGSKRRRTNGSRYPPTEVNLTVLCLVLLLVRHGSALSISKYPGDYKSISSSLRPIEPHCAGSGGHFLDESNLHSATTLREESSTFVLTDRRSVLTAFGTMASIGFNILGMATPSLSLETKATTVTSATPQSLLSSEDIAKILHPVPTFCLVDPNGVPYMVVGEDAKVTGYFFITYDEAARVLQLAKTSAAKGIAQAKREGQDDVGENPWTKARISTLPLDSVITLVYKSRRTKGVYFKIAPAKSDIDDALALSPQDDLAEGKVPLFYCENFVTSNGELPLYFRKKELEKAWRKSFPNDTSLPEVLVTELFSILGELIKPPSGNEKDNNDLRKLVLVAPQASEAKAKQCLRNGGKEPAFVIGQRIIVL